MREYFSMYRTNISQSTSMLPNPLKSANISRFLPKGDSLVKSRTNKYIKGKGNKMVLVSKLNQPPDPTLYFRESSSTSRTTRFCIKPVATTSCPLRGSTERQPDKINVQIVRGKANSVVNIDEEEARKIRHHGDYALKKIQKIKKNLIWNVLIGRSFVDGIRKASSEKGGNKEETNIDKDENLSFDPKNPKTWSEESLEYVESILKATEFSYDGFVVLFCVENDPKDPTVDYDELTWELEKTLIYHYAKDRDQISMNDEASMVRRGIEPVTRKTRTPGGKKRDGFFVYAAFQFMDSVNRDQMIGESVSKYTDIHAKKKQLLSVVNELKFLPQIDEKLRKSIKEIREFFVNKNQLELIYKVKEFKEPESIRLLEQFVNLLSSKGNNVMGLPQFLTFLNKSNEGHEEVEEDTVLMGHRRGGNMSSRASSRMSLANPPVRKYSPNLTRSSTLPRPKHRKTSVDSATMSSRSSTPEKPNDHSKTRSPNIMEESGLESIISSGSSTPETLKRRVLPKKDSSRIFGGRTTSLGTPPIQPVPAIRRRNTIGSSNLSLHRESPTMIKKISDKKESRRSFITSRN